jgi:hypothetical protein
MNVLFILLAMALLLYIAYRTYGTSYPIKSSSSMTRM